MLCTFIHIQRVNDMKYIFPNGHSIDLDDNEKVIAERYGAKPVTEADVELESLLEQAKELGIRGANLMKKETLIRRIAEAK